MIRRSLLCLCVLASVAIGWLWIRTSADSLSWHGILPGGQDWAHVNFWLGDFELFVITRKAVSEERPLSILAAEVEPIFTSGTYFHTGPIDPVEPGLYYLAHWGDRWTLDLQESPKMFIVQMPIWPLLLTCMLLPAISLLCVTVRRLRRKPPGHCENCGYNLTGNVSGICPECGEKPDAQVASE
ncbi:MAG: hypothetical protein GX600_11645 [Dehalococcoidia bacterium]|nr:hypothetical protein [Dehalococcoidia bacterium]